MAKCEHGSYIPSGATIALYCALCNPDGVPDGPTPVLPRSSGDPLNATRTQETNHCPECGCLRTYSQPACLGCGHVFGVGAGRQQLAANSKQAGVCPTCGSTVHYNTRKVSEWECADCGTKYPAPKQRGA